MARELDFADSFESSTAPSVGFISSTGFQSFANDAAFVAAKGSAATDGDTYKNSSTGQLRYYDGGLAAWRDVVSSEGAQTINGAKTFGNDVVIDGNLTVNGATTTVNSTTLDVEDPSISVNVGGTQATANTNVSGVYVDMTDATDARIGYDSTKASRFKAGEVGSEAELVTTSHTQTLTGKTIDGDDNTIQDLSLGSLKTVLADASKFVVRDVSGIVVSNSKSVPSGDVVGTSDSQVLTSKTIDGDDNTVQDLPLTAIKTVLADASKFISRDASGIPVSSKAVPTGTVVGTSDSQVLTNKTIDGDDNTVQDLPLTSIKTVLADASKFIVRDASGIPVSNTKAVPTGAVVGTTDSQVLTGKTIDGDDNTVQDLPLTAIKTNLTDASKFIVRDASGIPVSNTKAVPSGTVVGTSDTQALTNKDIDGGTASNSNRITLPKETTTNLNALTRKQGTIVFDTTTNAPKYDDGSALQPFTSTGGGGLTPTAVKTSAYTAASGDLVLADASSAAFNVTLPAATANNYVAVKKINSDTSFNAVTIVGTIDGVSNTTLNTFGECVYLVANGTEWKLIERRINTAGVSFTPTGGFTSNVTYTGRWYRRGNLARFRVYMTFTNTTTATTCTINLPSGMTIDTTENLASTANRQPFFSSGTVFDPAGGTTPYPLKVKYSSSSAVGVHYHVSPGSGTIIYEALLDNANPFTLNNNAWIMVDFEVPISGWNG